jgi:hypothetical protein
VVVVDANMDLWWYNRALKGGVTLAVLSAFLVTMACSEHVVVNDEHDKSTLALSAAAIKIPSQPHETQHACMHYYELWEMPIPGKRRVPIRDITSKMACERKKRSPACRVQHTRTT